MRERGGGAIVNVGSMWALDAIATTPTSAYSAAQAGRHALTKNLAIELAADGIRVNTVALAFVETPAYERFMSGDEAHAVLDVGRRVPSARPPRPARRRRRGDPVPRRRRRAAGSRARRCRSTAACWPGAARRCRPAIAAETDVRRRTAGSPITPLSASPRRHCPHGRPSRPAPRVTCDGALPADLGRGSPGPRRGHPACARRPRRRAALVWIGWPSKPTIESPPSSTVSPSAVTWCVAAFSPALRGRAADDARDRHALARDPRTSVLTPGGIVSTWTPIQRARRGRWRSAGRRPTAPRRSGSRSRRRRWRRPCRPGSGR